MSKTYATGQEETHAVVKVDVRFSAGEVVALVGPSGCGKSTLLNMIGLLTQPSSGLIELDGTNLQASKASRDARLRAEIFGYIVQDFALLEAETVASNVNLPLEYGRRRLGRRRRRSVVADALGKVGLSGFEKRRVRNLSGGQRQRVAIARALAANAQVLLADEPTGALDSENSSAVFELLRSLANSGRSVVVATHNLELASLCDRVVEMQDGRIVGEHPGKFRRARLEPVASG